jgi:hypothetical protein
VDTEEQVTGKAALAFTCKVLRPAEYIGVLQDDTQANNSVSDYTCTPVLTGGVIVKHQEFESLFA